MGMLKSIDLPSLSDDVIVYKYDMKGNVIKRGSVLTVREGQAAVFCDKGQTADVFGPGFYKLETDSLPLVTKLLSWKYGFETPYKSEVYFVNTKQFARVRWGTATPVLVQTEYGVLRLRGFGSYSFRVSDPARLLSELSGATELYTLSQAADALRSLLIGSLSTALANAGVTLKDVSSRYAELSAAVLSASEARCTALGLTLTAFDIENLSVPPETEKAVDENARLGLLRENIDVYTRLAQADALKAAASSGTAGTVVGVGLGMNLTQAVAGEGGKTCPSCHAPVSPTAKFCASCGKPLSGGFCPECGKPVPQGVKFCPECGCKLS